MFTISCAIFTSSPVMAVTNQIKQQLFRIFKKITTPLRGRGASKIPWVSEMYKFLSCTLKPKGTVLVSTLEQNKMFVDMNDEGIAPFLVVDKVYEPFTTELLKMSVKHSMVVIDVGANIGYHTLIAGKLVGKKGKVYAFEPQPYSYELLTKNIALNNLANIMPLQKAVSREAGKSKLFYTSAHLGASSFSDANIPDKISKCIEVDTVSLDEFFKKEIRETKIHFMKIDTQGAEGLVLDGAKEILKHHALKVIMEFWPYGLKNMGCNPAELLHRLRVYGFSLKIIEEKRKRLTEIDIPQLLKTCSVAKNGKADVNLWLEKEH